MQKPIILYLKVIPNSAKNEIVRWEEDRLVIKIRAIPEKGKANKGLLDFLADILNIKKSSLELLSGDTSRLKKVQITGLSLEELKMRISTTKQ